MIIALLFLVLMTGMHTEAAELIAHRGYSSRAPENTLAAFKLASDRGYHYVECDIQFTKDGVPIVMHDGTVNRTSNKKGKVKSYKLKGLKKLDVGTWKNQEYTGEQVPTLKEVLKFCKKKNLHLYLELKRNSGVTPKRLKKMYRMVCKAGMKSKVTWYSFQYTYLKSMKKIAPDAELGLILRKEITEKVLQKVKSLKSRKNKVFITVFPGLTDAKTIERCRQYGINLVARGVRNHAELTALDSYYMAALTNGY